MNTDVEPSDCRPRQVPVIRLGFCALASAALFLVLSVGGNRTGLMSNYACYSLLGCNMYFFGYDFVVHLTSGVAEVIALVWITSTFPSLDFLPKKLWQRVLVLSAVAALIGLCWEEGEFIADGIRLYWMHINLLVPNHLYQPSNADTMGDMAAGAIGAFITSWFSTLMARLKALYYN